MIAILWQMDIQPPDMGWLSTMKKTESPLGNEVTVTCAQFFDWAWNIHFD